VKKIKSKDLKINDLFRVFDANGNVGPGIWIRTKYNGTQINVCLVGNSGRQGEIAHREYPSNGSNYNCVVITNLGELLSGLNKDEHGRK